jgi:hypothetical protein
VEVSGFHPSLDTISNVPIASVAIAYDDIPSQETWILEFHQVLYSKDLPNGLLCPNQIRDNRHTVNDVPRQFATDKRCPTTHAIIADDLLISLQMNSVWSGFEFRTPILEWELYETLDCKRKQDAKATATGTRKGSVGAKQLADKWVYPSTWQRRQ